MNVYLYAVDSCTLLVNGVYLRYILSLVARIAAEDEVIHVPDVPDVRMSASLCYDVGGIPQAVVTWTANHTSSTSSTSTTSSTLIRISWRCAKGCNMGHVMYQDANIGVIIVYAQPALDTARCIMYTAHCAYIC